MLILHLLGQDSSRAWTDWSGRGFRKKSISERLKAVCPSLRLTERKRLAKRLADGAPVSFRIEVPEHLGGLTAILEATGAQFTIDDAQQNHSSEPGLGVPLSFVTLYGPGH